MTSSSSASTWRTVIGLIRVIDVGRGFDSARLRAEDPTPEAEQGRGLQLMQALVDRVDLTSRPEAGTIVTLEKVLTYADERAPGGGAESRFEPGSHRSFLGCQRRSVAAGATKGRVMGIIGWIVLGLLAGAIAKAILPGDDPGGIIVTIIIGIVGAILGGFLAQVAVQPGHRR